MTAAIRETPRRVTHADVRVLVGVEGPRVTLYLPVDATVPQVKQNAVRHRQAVEEAQRKLAALGAEVGAPEAWGARLTAVESDVGALPSPTRGLAIFADATTVRAFALRSDVEPRVAAGLGWALRPLLELLNRDRPYRVLALSANRVALFEGDSRGLHGVEAPDVPGSLEQALGSELVGGTLQFRSGAGRGGGPIYHGHGGARDEREVDLERFHHEIASAVGDFWKERDDALVLAADQIHQGPFRATASLRGLLSEGCAGSPDRLSPDELHAQTWPIVERALVQEGREAAAAYERARNKGKIVDLLDDVVSAAVRGRVRVLWVDATHRVPGRVDPATARTAPARGDEDVLDETAGVVLQRGGEVRVVPTDEVPGASGMAAELR